jgi:tetratricopeptide (TPR) repeat protein
MRVRRSLGVLVLLLPALGCSSREEVADEAIDRGNAALDQHDYDTAVAEFTEAIRHDPESDAAYHNRAHAYASKKDYARAIPDYNESIRLAPEDPESYTDLAWLLATCPDANLRDGKRAVGLATRACDLNRWRDANDIENLAAGYAECGQFDEAVKWQAKALDVGTGLLHRDEARQRLDLYKAGKPFREE